MTTATVLQVNLDHFIQDVRKLEDHVHGIINMTTCMGIVRDIYEAGYQLSINKSHPFVVYEDFQNEVMDEAFKELQAGDGNIVTMKMVKKKEGHDTLTFLYIFVDRSNMKFATVYKLSKLNK
jgi:hypothetical protein